MDYLNDNGLPQIIVSSNYNVSPRKIFFRWSVQLLDESLLFGTEGVHRISYTQLSIG